ncbi:MAG: type II toxin-antitoxin system Phd/YefM family antitoxin [Planctomycetes bacterium]|nr:type II toxin-antitoxin system Phd/YefM family antitoxin [Planctomycetota bacterium]
MLNLADDIRSLTEFKRDTASAVKHLRATGRPMILTVNGRAELVVQDPAAYQRLLDLAERMETVLAIEQGLRDVEEGRTRPIRDVIKNLGKKNAVRG